MSGPSWVDERVAHFLHSEAVARHGGSAGMLNANSLASALLRPQITYHYRDPKPDIVELAAIYVLAICKAHAFMHANKRTAFLICATFLANNGYAFDPPLAETIDFFAKVADDKNTGITEQHVVDWLRQYAKPALPPVEVLRSETDAHHRYRITRTPRGFLLSMMQRSQIGLLLGPSEWLYQTEEAAQKGLKGLMIFNTWWAAVNRGCSTGDLPQRAEAALAEHKEVIERLNDQPLIGREVRELRIMIEGDGESDGGSTAS